MIDKNTSRVSAVLFARDLGKISDFYEQVFMFPPLTATRTTRFSS